MEDLLLSPVEQKLLLKSKNFLQRKYNVNISISECVSPSENDVVVATVQGEKSNLVKNFIHRQMVQMRKRQEQRFTVQNNVPTITISDSDSDTPTPVLVETQNAKRKRTRKRKRGRSANLGQNANPGQSANTESNQLEDLASTILVEDSDESANEDHIQVQKRLREELPPPVDFIPLNTEKENNVRFDGIEGSVTSSTSVNFEPPIPAVSFAMQRFLMDAATSSANVNFVPPTPSPSFLMQRFLMNNAQINGNSQHDLANNGAILCGLPLPGYSSLRIGKEKENTLVNDDSDIIIEEEIPRPVVNEPKCLRPEEIPRPVVNEPKCLRPIVIDGSNVAREHGKISNTFSCKGIKIAIDYFMQRGHTQVTAFVPQFRRYTKFGPVLTTDQPLLEELAKEQRVVFTPSRRVNNKTIACYDDRFIVDLATQNGGVILSNDNYRDIAAESDVFKKTIDERLLMFCFVGDIIMIPQDPLGRDGPSLENFLSFQS